MLKVHYVVILVFMAASLVLSAQTSKNEESKIEGIEGKAIDKTDDQSEIDLISNECNETFIIEMSYLEALNESGSFPDETDKTPKCYLRCLLQKTGVASDDGEISPSKAATVFAGERGGKHMELEESATKCVNDHKETDKCEMAYQFMKCLMESEIMKYE